MIKLSHDLYHDFEDEYFEVIQKKTHGGKSIFSLVNRLSSKESKYKLSKSQKEDFLKALIINPFTDQARNNFLLLDDYYRTMISKKIDLLANNRRSILNTLKYQSIIDSTHDHKTLRVRVIEASKLEVCPYCNRQYIDVFQKGNHGYKGIAQLDHFYPKDIYPLYSLTLYNFVPSCASCNQGKSTRWCDIIYPFSENASRENREPYFRIKVNDLEELMGNKLPEIEYAFNDQNTKNHADFFHHQNMYANHRSFVQKLLRAQRLDNEGYRKGINELFKKSNIHLEPGELKELLYGFNGSDEELLQKPLSKLARDIIGRSKNP